MNITLKHVKDLTKDLGDIFSEDVPSIIQVAHEHDLLEALAPLFRRVYRDNKTIKDRILIESFLTSALYHCNDKYCYLIHASSLLEMGVKSSQIIDLTSLAQLPVQVENRIKWNNVLKSLFFLFKDNELAVENVAGIRNLVSEDEFEDLTQIIALANNLRYVYYFYHEELGVVSTERLKSELGKVYEELKDLVKYYERTKEDSKVPVVSMCMFCKDVRSNEGKWFPIEFGFKFLKESTLFSHSICDKCASLTFESK